MVGVKEARRAMQELKRADVRRCHGKMPGRCLWCGRERWSPGTTPGWTEKSVTGRRGDPDYVELTWRGDEWFKDAVSRVHWECWIGLGASVSLRLTLREEVKRPPTPEQRTAARESRKKKHHASVDADVSQILSIPDGRACIRCNGYGAFASRGAPWYKPESVGEAFGTAYKISWPEFGYVGAHEDYAHAECWLSWPTATRKRKAQRDVIDFDANPGELKLT